MPGRNILFLTLAAIYAYQVGAEAVITGVCETDFSGYPGAATTSSRRSTRQCRSGWIASFASRDP